MNDSINGAMNTTVNRSALAPHIARSSLVAVMVGAVLLVSGCKTNSAGGGGDAPSTPSQSGGSSGTPLPNTSGTSAPATPSTSSGSTASLPTSGAESAAGMPAAGSAAPPAGGEVGSAGTSGTSGRAQTPEERRVAIDKRLDDSLGTFDSEIRKEQERNAQERDARNAANAGTAQTETGTDTEEQDDDLESGSAGTERAGDDKKDRQSRPGDLKSEKDRKKADGGSAGPQGTSGSAASEVPDGSDDDVVARRLRKAAEAETDPELKEKLWKEYIEYKKGAK
jgi:hypothetical protein